MKNKYYHKWKLMKNYKYPTGICILVGSKWNLSCCEPFLAETKEQLKKECEDCLKCFKKQIERYFKLNNIKDENNNKA